MAKSLTNGVK